MPLLPYDSERFLIIEGKREYAPVGSHVCHDGIEYPLNAGGCCDRCGENVEKLFNSEEDHDPA